MMKHPLKICVVILPLLLFLVCCSTISYEQEGHENDVPLDVGTIYLENVIPTDAEVSQTCAGGDKDQTETRSSSLDNLFVSKIINAHLAYDFVHASYRVVQNFSEPYDVRMKVLLHYQPDNWPFANRSIQIKATLYKANGSILFCVNRTKNNLFGSLGDYIGFSGEEMLSDIAQEVVGDVLGQFHKKPAVEDGL